MSNSLYISLHISTYLYSTYLYISLHISTYLYLSLHISKYNMYYVCNVMEWNGMEWNGINSIDRSIDRSIHPSIHPSIYLYSGYMYIYIVGICISVYLYSGGIYLYTYQFLWLSKRPPPPKLFWYIGRAITEIPQDSCSSQPRNSGNYTTASSTYFLFTSIISKSPIYILLNSRPHVVGRSKYENFEQWKSWMSWNLPNC